MDKTGGHYAKRSDPGTERKTMHSLIYVIQKYQIGWSLLEM